MLALASSACTHHVEPTPRASRLAPDATQWVGTWSASPQLVEPRNLPPAPGLSGSTLRQVVRITIGGQRVRFRFSNEFGTSPVSITEARVALADSGSAIRPESDRALTFQGKQAVVIPAGGTVVSEALDFAVDPLSRLTVSLHVAAISPDVITGHPGSRTTSYLQTGDWTRAVEMPQATKTEHWYIISGVDVLSGGESAAVVVLGNSITDGRGSGTDRDNRWPDNLARRLQADSRTRHVAVLNAGIGGNAVVRGGLGPTARERLERDVLAQSGARWLIVLAGVNDIGAARGSEAAAAVADSLITSYQEIISRSRLNGILVLGATILPFGASFYDDPAREAARQKVNRWIRTSGAWDAVIDFDAALRDPDSPGKLRSEADGGDHLHPNETGYRLMAEAIDLELFLRR